MGRRLRARTQVGGPRHVRAGDDVRRVRRLLRAGPVRGAGAALPGRRVQGAAADRARGRHAPRSCADLIEWLGELVRQVDSSLLDEWERLRNPDGGERRGRRLDDRAAGGHRATSRAFRVLVRNALFRRVELAALRRYDLLGELDARGRLGRRRLGGRDGRRTSTEHDDARHRRRTPAGRRCCMIDRGARTAGGCGRSSTTRPATTTGASAPRSTWPRPTRPGAAAVTRHRGRPPRLRRRATARPRGRGRRPGGPR